MAIRGRRRAWHHERAWPRLAFVGALRIDLLERSDIGGRVRDP